MAQLPFNTAVAVIMNAEAFTFSQVYKKNNAYSKNIKLNVCQIRKVHNILILGA